MGESSELVVHALNIIQQLLQSLYILRTLASQKIGTKLLKKYLKFNVIFFYKDVVKIDLIKNDTFLITNIYTMC